MPAAARIPPRGGRGKAATASPAKRRAATGASTEDRLLTVAARLFGKHGYDGVSTKRLAAEAGLTIGALYHYFAGKDAIYSAATRRAFASRAALPKTLRESTADAETRLAQLVAWFVGNVIFDKHVGMLLQRELLDPRADTGALLENDLFRDAFDLFRQLLRELLPRADLDEALASLLALVFGLSNLKSIHTLAPRVRNILSSPDDIGRHATALLLHGLRG